MHFTAFDLQRSPSSVELPTPCGGAYRVSQRWDLGIRVWVAVEWRGPLIVDEPVIWYELPMRLCRADRVKCWLSGSDWPPNHFSAASSVDGKLVVLFTDGMVPSRRITECEAPIVWEGTLDSPRSEWRLRRVAFAS